MWKAVDGGIVNKNVLNAALNVAPKKKDSRLRENKEATLFLFRYTDGLLGSVLMLPAYLGGISVGVKLKSKRQPVATHFEERLEPCHPHFAYLLKAIERMIHAERPAYPVERTVLTTGVLDRALLSLSEDYRRLTTPELAISYQPIDYLHAPHQDLSEDPR